MQRRIPRGFERVPLADELRTVTVPSFRTPTTGTGRRASKADAHEFHIGHGSLYKEKHPPPVHVQMGSAAHSGLSLVLALDGAGFHVYAFAFSSKVSSVRSLSSATVAGHSAVPTLDQHFS